MMSTYTPRNTFTTPPELREGSSLTLLALREGHVPLPQALWGGTDEPKTAGWSLRAAHPNLGAPRSQPPVSHQEGTGCRKASALLQQPHSGSFKAIVRRCETHTGLAAKLYVAFKPTGLAIAPSPPGAVRAEDGAAALAPSGTESCILLSKSLPGNSGCSQARTGPAGALRPKR